jgi:hypothetical protein
MQACVLRPESVLQEKARGRHLDPGIDLFASERLPGITPNDYRSFSGVARCGQPFLN